MKAPAKTGGGTQSRPSRKCPPLVHSGHLPGTGNFWPLHQGRRPCGKGASSGRPEARF